MYVPEPSTSGGATLSDFRAWTVETTWPGEMPTAAEVWERLHSDGRRGRLVAAEHRICGQFGKGVGQRGQLPAEAPEIQQAHTFDNDPGAAC